MLFEEIAKLLYFASDVELSGEMASGDFPLATQYMIL